MARWDASPLDKAQTVSRLKELGQDKMAALVEVVDPAAVREASAEFAGGDQPEILGVLWRFNKWVQGS